MNSIRLTIVGALAAVIALAGLATGSATAAPWQDSTAYSGPGAVFYPGSPVTYGVQARSYGADVPATISTLSPAVCTVAPTAPGKANVTFKSKGTCTLSLAYAAGVSPGGSFPAFNDSRSIPVFGF